MVPGLIRYLPGRGWQKEGKVGGAERFVLFTQFPNTLLASKESETDEALREGKVKFLLSAVLPFIPVYLSIGIVAYLLDPSNNRSLFETISNIMHSLGRQEKYRIRTRRRYHLQKYHIPPNQRYRPLKIPVQQQEQQKGPLLKNTSSWQL